MAKENPSWKLNSNSSFCLCKQVISVRRKALSSALFVHANAGHRFPGCGQAGEPPGDGGGVKFVTEQIWPLVSGIHLNPNLISNVKYTQSPFLASLNKWPPDSVRGKSGGGKWICVSVCVFVCTGVYDLSLIFINLSFFNSLHPSGEVGSTDGTTKTHLIK